VERQASSPSRIRLPRPRCRNSPCLAKCGTCSRQDSTLGSGPEAERRELRQSDPIDAADGLGRPLDPVDQGSGQPGSRSEAPPEPIHRFRSPPLGRKSVPTAPFRRNTKARPGHIAVWVAAARRLSRRRWSKASGATKFNPPRHFRLRARPRGRPPPAPRRAKCNARLDFCAIDPGSSSLDR
jgi:hypothetical protein